MEFNKIKAIPPRSLMVQGKYGVTQFLIGHFDDPTGFWTWENTYYRVNLPCGDSDDGVFREIDVQFVNLRWDKIAEKLIQEKRTKEELEKIAIEDLLISLGVINIVNNPGVYINGMPGQQIVVNPEYQVIISRSEPPQIIDITEQVVGKNE